MDVFKCMMPLRHEGILNSRRNVSPLVRLVEREGRWEAPDLLHGVLPQNWERYWVKFGKLSPVWYLKLQLRTGVHLALCRAVFRGLRSDFVSQEALPATT
ncbi:hypothetical protein TNCV_4858171 [Trichonephila clavipes]|nr:hypothetical protein TNCV_4858171 [Trichonephila clavipes]